VHDRPVATAGPCSQALSAAWLVFSGPAVHRPQFCIGIHDMMVLYSGTTCPFSQRCRFVLFEKGMDFEIRDIDLYNKPEDIAVMNPYGQVPILV
jgi:hypothetical protein